MSAPREAVWSALVDPARLSRWFAPVARLDARPGGSLRFEWPDGDWAEGVVLEVEQGARLVFEWAPFQHLGSDIPAEVRTRVEIVLSEHRRGTHLLLTESGFERLPEGVRRVSQADNEWGWDEMLFELRGFLKS